jgi:hypothetical protein
MYALLARQPVEDEVDANDLFINNHPMSTVTDRSIRTYPVDSMYSLALTL